MKKLKRERSILILVLLLSLAMHFVYGLEGAAQVGSLETKIDRQAAQLRDKQEEIKVKDTLIDGQYKQIENLNKQLEEQSKKTYIGEFTVTFYCPCYKCCGKTDGITASGTIATEGQTVAADWDILPPGTKIFIEGIGFRTVEDKGGGIKGNKLDVFMDSHSAAHDAGVVRAKVYIVED